MRKPPKSPKFKYGLAGREVLRPAVPIPIEEGSIARIVNKGPGIQWIYSVAPSGKESLQAVVFSMVPRPSPDAGLNAQQSPTRPDGNAPSEQGGKLTLDGGQEQGGKLTL